MSEKSQVIELNFNEKWTADDWIQWAYKLGLRLDQWIPWCGIDNRKRIEEAIVEYVNLKLKPYKLRKTASKGRGVKNDTFCRCG